MQAQLISEFATLNMDGNNNSCKSGEVTVTEEQRKNIEYVRRRFLEEYEANPHLYDSCDRERVAKHDYWVSRFINWLDQGPEKAFEHMKETFRWRRSYGVNCYDPLEIPLEVYQMGPVFRYLDDPEGRSMLYVRCKMHRKIPEIEERIKKSFLNYVEKIDSKANREFGFNIVFDMNGSGYSNVDLDMLFFVITTIRKHYPNGNKYTYILGLPWILNSVAKFALALIPSDTARKVKFLSLNEFHQIMPPNTIPDFLGGTASEVYRKIPRGAKDCIQLGKEIYGLSETEVLKLLKPSLKYVEEGKSKAVFVDDLIEFYQ